MHVDTLFHVMYRHPGCGRILDERIVDAYAVLPASVTRKSRVELGVCPVEEAPAAHFIIERGLSSRKCVSIWASCLHSTHKQPVNNPGSVIPGSNPLNPRIFTHTC